MARAAECGRNSCPSIGSVVQHCDTTTQLGQSGAVTKVAGRGFSDTAVIVHLTVYQPTRIVLRAEGLFQKRCHEQRNHVHACCASALVSCDLSLSLSLYPSAPLFFLLPSFLLFFYSLPRSSIFHLVFSVSFSHCSYTRPQHRLYLLYCSFTGYLSLIPGYTRWTRVCSLHKARVHD